MKQLEILDEKTILSMLITQIDMGIDMVIKDKNSKRYYINPQSLNKKLVSKEVVENMQGLFSQFYFITIKALISKT